MFSNLDKKNRSHQFPEFKSGEMLNTAETIDNPIDFLKIFINSQAQLSKIAEYLKSGKNIYELIEINKEINKNTPYLTFTQYLTNLTNIKAQMLFTGCSAFVCVCLCL